jgi:large subunit ribosomal protein L4
VSLSLELRDISGDTTGSVELDEAIFGIQPNVAVMHQVVMAQLAAARAGTHSTKTRAEVSGGGKKPFKQKGTGRARQGSERAPHFAGGGIAFGPKPRSYRQKTPRKMIQLALRSALSDRASEDKIAVVAEWPWEQPSTREAKVALETLGLEGRVLVVLGRQDQEAYKSFRNLPNVQVLLDAELNAYDVLCHDWIVFTSETLPGGGVTNETAGAVVASAGSAEGPADSEERPAADDGGPADVDDADAVEPENLVVETEDGNGAEDALADETATPPVLGAVGEEEPEEEEPEDE